MEWLAGLPVEQRKKITHFMYDDMCHLKVKVHNVTYFSLIILSQCQKFACNQSRATRTELSTFFAQRTMCVDFLHFKYRNVNMRLVK